MYANPDGPQIMGILNVTPDSFYDGGRYTDPTACCDHAAMMVASGAHIIDVGAESSRPGSERLSVEEEWQRLKPILPKLRRRITVPISLDTTKAEIARRGLDEGVDIINDISAGRFNPEMLTTVSASRADYVLMHMQREPKTMQQAPQYDDVVQDLFRFFEDTLEKCASLGLCHDRIILDPGLGFGKTAVHNLKIIRDIKVFSKLGCRVLLGASRKSFLGTILTEDVQERLEGSLAIAVYSALQGVSMLRVHDVKGDSSGLSRCTSGAPGCNLGQKFCSLRLLYAQTAKTLWYRWGPWRG